MRRRQTNIDNIVGHFCERWQVCRNLVGWFLDHRVWLLGVGGKRRWPGSWNDQGGNMFGRACRAEGRRRRGSRQSKTRSGHYREWLRCPAAFAWEVCPPSTCSERGPASWGQSAPARRATRAGARPSDQPSEARLSGPAEPVHSNFGSRFDCIRSLASVAPRCSSIEHGSNIFQASGRTFSMQTNGVLTQTSNEKLFSRKFFLFQITFVWDNVSCIMFNEFQSHHSTIKFDKYYFAILEIKKYICFICYLSADM